MIDRLRAFMDRPLRDADRPRMFALAVVLLCAGAGLLALLDGPAAPPDPAPARATPEPAPARSLPEAVSPASASDGEAPSEEGEPPAALAVSRPRVEAAKRAARRFMTGYLPYLYGRRGARSIPAADARLRARLARGKPRTHGDARRRRPRVVLLHAQGVAAGNGTVAALVSDGVSSYSVLLELERARRGWRVTDVGS